MFFDFLLFKKLDQRNYIKFDMLILAFGESTISRIRVQLKYNWFKEGLDALTGHPDENIEAMKRNVFE